MGRPPGKPGTRIEPESLVHETDAAVYLPVEAGFFRAGKPDCHSPDNGASFIKIRGNGYIGSNAFADPCVTESKQVSVIRLVVIVGILRTAETQI